MNHPWAFVMVGQTTLLITLGNSQNYYCVIQPNDR